MSSVELLTFLPPPPPLSQLSTHSSSSACIFASSSNLSRSLFQANCAGVTYCPKKNKCNKITNASSMHAQCLERRTISKLYFSYCFFVAVPRYILIYLKNKNSTVSNLVDGILMVILKCFADIFFWNYPFNWDLVNEDYLLLEKVHGSFTPLKKRNTCFIY